MRDIDEAAWIFNGRYLDLFVAGAFDDPDWTAFDAWAHHPPVGNYVVGALLHAVGEPMTSMEPRRFWYEHDVDIVLDPQTYQAGLAQRVRPAQLLALRWFSALCTWLTVLATMWLGARLAGWRAAVVTGFLLFLHPLFMGLGRIGTLDSFSTLVTAAMLVCAYELGRPSLSSSRSRSVLLGAALCLTFTIAFGTKVVGFVSVVPALIALAMAGPVRRSSLVVVAVAVAVALLMTVLLDPSLHDAAIAQTLRRLEWRLDRVSIQQVLYVDQRLVNVDDRVRYVVWLLVLSSPAAVALGALSMVGASFAVAQRSRALVGVLGLAAFFGLLTVVTMPMMWSRYAAPGLPSLACAAGVTAAVASLALRGRRVAASVVIAVVSTLAVRTALVEHHTPAVPSTEEREVARLFAIAMKGDADIGLHEALLGWFERTNNVRRAAAQRALLRAGASTPGS